MGKTLILPGEFHSILSRAESVVASEEHADYPVTNLYDGRPSFVWRGTTASATAKTIDITAQFMKNGTLNGWTGGVPNNFTHNGTGTVTEDTSVKTEGSSSARLNTTGSEIRSDPIPVGAGERLKIQGDMRALAGGDEARVRVASLRTGLHLQSSGAWGVFASTFSETGTTFAAKSLEFVVQDVDELGGPGDLLQVIFRAQTDGGYFDNWWLLPEVDFASFHGHNMGSSISTEKGSAVNVITIYRGDSSPASTTVDLFGPSTILSPAFYKRLFLGPFVNKYWRVELLSGSAGFDFSDIDPPEIGEFALGRAIELTQNPSYGVELAEDWPQERQEVEGVTVQSFNLSRHQRRRVLLPFNTTTPTYEQVRDFLFRATRGGQDPVIVVPDDDRPEVVFGHVARNFEPSYPTFDRWSYDVVIEESPFAVPLA